MTKKLLLIANDKSGIFTTNTQTVEGILNKYEIGYQLVRVNNSDDIQKACKKANPKSHSAVAVFGGDGTVANSIRQLVGHKLPVMILPGGSANSLAKIFNPTVSIDKLLRYYAQGNYRIQRLQLAEKDGQSMVLDAHYGLFAETLEQTPQSLKNIFGQLAYAAMIIKKVMSSRPVTYKLKLNDRVIETEGHVCFIVNYGRVRMLGQWLLPRFRQGELRLVIIRQANLAAIITWYFSKLFLGRNTPGIVIARRAESITILKASGDYSYDDEPQMPPKLPAKFTVSPKSIYILTPFARRRSWLAWLRLIRIGYYRAADRIRRFITGNPVISYSRISKNLYLGGQYRKSAVKLFNRWNVTGVVSMREYIPKEIKGIDILHLSTVDHTAPRIEDLERGVKFIQAKIDKGESVYIHCHLGVGRGPSMAAAYLISTGMRPEDAIYHLQKTRPHARPNKNQVAQLMKFADRYE